MTPTSPAKTQTPVTLFLGPGGVGKTTMSAAYGIAAARRGERVVVLTIDPARRLVNTLGLSEGGLGHGVTTVPGDWPGRLSATMLDPAEMFTQIITEQASSTEQRERIADNRIFQNLLTSLSGTNEYMASERLYQLSMSGDYDRVIVDTPPAKHAIDFLDSPQRLSHFLNHQLYRTIFNPKSSFRQTLNLAAQRLLKLLGGIVGAELVDDVVDFFADFEGLDSGFAMRARKIDELLRSNASSYLLVTSARSQPLRESRWIADSLAGRNRNVQTIIANRTTPLTVNSDSSLWAANAAGPLQENFAEMHRLACAEESELKALAAAPAGGVSSPILPIPEQSKPVNDLASLSALADYLGAEPAVW